MSTLFISAALWKSCDRCGNNTELRVSLVVYTIFLLYCYKVTINAFSLNAIVLKYKTPLVSFKTITNLLSRKPWILLKNGDKGFENHPYTFFVHLRNVSWRSIKYISTNIALEVLNLSLWNWSIIIWNGQYFKIMGNDVACIFSTPSKIHEAISCSIWLSKLYGF